MSMTGLQQLWTSKNETPHRATIRQRTYYIKGCEAFWGSMSPKKDQWFDRAICVLIFRIFLSWAKRSYTQSKTLSTLEFRSKSMQKSHPTYPITKRLKTVRWLCLEKSMATQWERFVLANRSSFVEVHMYRTHRQYGILQSPVNRQLHQAWEELKQLLAKKLKNWSMSKQRWWKRSSCN